MSFGPGSLRGEPSPFFSQNFQDMLLFLILHLAGLTIRNIYEALKKSGRVDSRNKLVFAVVFAAMCLMWAGWFEMGRLDPMKLALPAPVRFAGLLLVVVGVILAVASLIQLKGLENIDSLGSSGLFSKIRHPMYTGFILWILGWAAYHGAALSLAVGLAGIGSILYWQRLEDASLESRFGEAYRRYRKGAWF
jgi:protein-S-isoprenylcysteine O-methyltransferase Ste14